MVRHRILIDENIPFIRGVFEGVADVYYAGGREIDAEMVRGIGADALIVRTRTRCDRGLLEGSGVRLIASATIGTDHIDAEYCRRAGIEVVNAPGCNARSVGQYVGAALGVYARERGVSLEGKVMGIVGHGHVGHEVERIARWLGMEVLLCDPPREERGESGYVDLESVARRADVITVHTPLTMSGRHRTYHLIDSEIMGKMERSPLVINAARGGVVDEMGLMAALACGRVSDAVVDCWENEPEVDRKLLDMVLIGTPHIAGYSADGKLNATREVVKRVSEFFGLCVGDVAGLGECRRVDGRGKKLGMEMVSNYDICGDSERLKSAPDSFEWLRNNYPVRRELDIE